MVRRKKEKKRLAFGIPKGIVLLATPEGWRTSVLTVERQADCTAPGTVPRPAVVVAAL
ncbi:hypothetical protein [Streptomyces sp. NPDC060031]|uniref:hypothetical protein n=1 Tax=Streptomyces sp. NPDC060031 TaxID=3347043 RepID=UPI0036C6AC15